MECVGRDGAKLRGGARRVWVALKKADADTSGMLFAGYEREAGYVRELHAFSETNEAPLERVLGKMVENSLEPVKELFRVHRMHYNPSAPCMTYDGDDGRWKLGMMSVVQSEESVRAVRRFGGRCPFRETFCLYSLDEFVPEGPEADDARLSEFSRSWAVAEYCHGFVLAAATACCQLERFREVASNTSSCSLCKALRGLNIDNRHEFRAVTQATLEFVRGVLRRSTGEHPQGKEWHPRAASAHKGTLSNHQRSTGWSVPESNLTGSTV